ncbi:MAG: PaaI family thioesterase [Ilumatobacter sp.]|nr:MAG: PaaI family thioesterase [Ilumatobacter sp.]
MSHTESLNPESIDEAYRSHLRLTDALRRVVEANAGVRLPAAGAEDLVAMADALAERLEALAGDGRYHVADGPDAFLDEPGRAMAINPIIGHCSPIAPPVEMSLRGGQVRGTTRLGQAYVGPPGRVHGGWVCALLDQVLGFACVADGNPSFTASITVHLRKATPLNTDLELTGRVTDVSGRRVTAWGAIHADGELTAEAEGLFVRIPSDFGVGNAS